MPAWPKRACQASSALEALPAWRTTPCITPKRSALPAPPCPVCRSAGVRTGEPTIEPESVGEMKQAGEAAMRRPVSSASAEPTLEAESVGEMGQAGEAAMRRPV